MFAALESSRPRAARVDEMPLQKLKERADEARLLLREALACVGTVGGMRAIDSALDSVERKLPGLMDRDESPALIAVRRLDPVERCVLRAALRTGRDATAMRSRAFLGISVLEAHDALERIDIYDALSVEVMRILRAIETEYALPMYASAADDGCL